MNFTDNDIDYSRLDWHQFEELCFDLLVKYQFYDLNWRQGGADGGRDIEAKFTASNPVTGPYEEKWFIECKHTKALNPANLLIKFAMAQVENIDHFLIVTSSHISTDNKTWVSKYKDKYNFNLHLLEGKNLKKRLHAFPELIAEYFADNVVQMIRELFRQWLFHDALPAADTLLKIQRDCDPDKLALDELLFLMFAYKEIGSKLDDLYPDEEDERPSADFLMNAIKANANHKFPVLNKKEHTSLVRDNYFLGMHQSIRQTIPDTPVMQYHEIFPTATDEMLQIYFARNADRRIDARAGIYHHVAQKPKE